MNHISNAWLKVIATRLTAIADWPDGEDKDREVQRISILLGCKTAEPIEVKTES